MVEFAGDTPQELAAQAEAVEATLRRHHHQGTIIHQTTAQKIANMWAVRKAGFGLLMSMRGRPRRGFLPDHVCLLRCLSLEQIWLAKFILIGGVFFVKPRLVA